RGDHGGNGASWRICRRDYLRLARGAYLAAMARSARLIERRSYNWNNRVLPRWENLPS
ncbi:MAG: hypothetical protein ACI906_004652, partial [Candidatus Latescibacterota bacterium]